MTREQKSFIHVVQKPLIRYVWYAWKGPKNIEEKSFFIEARNVLII